MYKKYSYHSEKKNGNKNNKKNIFNKNERRCRDVKTEKAQEQDGIGNKMNYHFHITTLHKYTQLE